MKRKLPGYTMRQVETYRRVNYITHTVRENVPPGSHSLSLRKCTTRVPLIKPADISHPRLFAHAGA